MVEEGESRGETRKGVLCSQFLDLVLVHIEEGFQRVYVVDLGQVVHGVPWLSSHILHNLQELRQFKHLGNIIHNTIPTGIFFNV